MAFGRQPGPPASHQQMRELLELLGKAGYGDFREARRPLGLSQRQAGGRFTRDEAQELIDRLEEAEAEASAPARLRLVPEPRAEDPALRDVPSEHLAAELRRRGWTVAKR